MLNVERLDYTKGVPQKLAAIRHFLEHYPEKREKVVFALIAVPSRQNVDEYAELTDEVQREIGAINGDYGNINHVPVNFLHRGYPPEELAAFYAVADVCLVTPLVDGMNLVAKEFVDCKVPGTDAAPGVLILSEFAGAAAEMSQALLVNPYSEKAVSSAIAQALAMPPQEQWERLHTMQEHLSRNDAGAWAGRFLQFFENEGLEETQPKQNLLSVFNDAVQAVKDRKRLSLFLDYDGTLRRFTLRPEEALPDSDLLPLLRRLRAKADLTIISGRPAEFLEENFGGEGFHLVAEHGYRWLLSGAGKW